LKLALLGGQLFATVCTAGIDDLATGFGGHPGPKAVAAFANQVRGLKGAFHRSVSDLIGGLTNGIATWPMNI
jgi:hypothetical protein